MIRAYINYASFGASVHVSLVSLNEQDASVPRHVLRLQQVGDGENAFITHAWERIDPDDPPTAPTLTLGHEEANALMRGLSEFYGGVDDQRLLRKDYVEERQRVDGLISVLSDCVRTRAT